MILVLYFHIDLKYIEEVYNKELNNVSEWIDANKVTLNEFKSKVVNFHPKYKKLKQNIVIKIDKKVIQESNCPKYLGVLIDKKLTWNEKK